MIRRRLGVVLTTLTVAVAACSGSSTPAAPDSEAAIALLPKDAAGPFPLVDASRLQHGWVAVSPNGDRDAIVEELADHGVDFDHDGAAKGGWVSVEDDDTAVRIVFDTRRGEPPTGPECADHVEHDEGGTPRTAIEHRTDPLGMVQFVVQHKHWRGRPAAFVSVRRDDGTRLVLNAITVDDGSLVLVSTCA